MSLTFSSAGSTVVVDIAGDLAPPPGDFTVSLWVYPTVDADVGVLQMYRSRVGPPVVDRRGFVIFRQGPHDKPSFLVNPSGLAAGNYHVTHGSDWTLNNWNHLLAEWDATAGTASLLLNGSDSTTGTTGTPFTGPIYDNAQNFEMGRINEINHIDARLAEVGIWNRKLTPGEKGQLYAQAYRPSAITDSLALYQPMVAALNEETAVGATLTDATAGLIAADHPPMYDPPSESDPLARFGRTRHGLPRFDLPRTNLPR